MYDLYLLSDVIVIVAFKMALLMEKLFELSLTVTTERPQIYRRSFPVENSRRPYVGLSLAYCLLPQSTINILS